MNLKRSAKLLAASAALAVIGGLAMPLAASAATASPPPQHHVYKVHLKGRVIYPVHVRGHVVIPVKLTRACEEKIAETVRNQIVEHLVEKATGIELIIVAGVSVPFDEVLLPLSLYEGYGLWRTCTPDQSPPPPYSTLRVIKIPVRGPLPLPLPGSSPSAPTTPPTFVCPNPTGCVG